MTQNQIAYWNYKETQRSNQAREREAGRSNRATEMETRRSNLAREKEANRSNLARESETVRSNVARERETRRSNLAAEVELGRHNAATEEYQRNSNRISAYKAEKDYEYKLRQMNQDRELNLLANDLARFRAATERASALNEANATIEKLGLQREWNAVQAELQRLGVQGQAVNTILNFIGRIGGGLLNQI